MKSTKYGACSFRVSKPIPDLISLCFDLLSLVSFSCLFCSQAYMLFYERCDKDPASAPSSSFSAKETAAAASVAQDTK